MKNQTDGITPSSLVTLPLLGGEADLSPEQSAVVLQFMSLFMAHTTIENEDGSRTHVFEPIDVPLKEIFDDPDL
jgi:hypothetical protein